MKKKVFLLTVWVLAVTALYAQKSCVLWDKEYSVPISKVSVFAAVDGRVNSTTSDDEGRVIVDFAFDSLTISHVNYRKQVVTSLPDTLFLVPLVHILPEVVVVGGEPSWIRQKLGQFLKVKEEIYGNSSVFSYDYQTQNVGNEMLYGFSSKGLIRRGEEFEILPSQSIIIYKDRTAGCDYTNLKNSLYHDFVSDLDKRFIKEHRFVGGSSQEDNDSHIVKVAFRSNKVANDSGYFYMDTARCVILSAVRHTGLEYNVKTRTNSLVLATFKTFYGHNYKDWKIDYQVTYNQHDGHYYLSDCRYSNYMIEEFDRKKMKGIRFYHLTSTYTAQPKQGNCYSEAEFLKLPRPFAMKIIMSKKEANKEKRLQDVDKEYIIY
ncbi:MAG: hypothetical protein ACTTKN_00465 [Phocaeicola sp.]|uniref:hypothetical protein n=1 Tax=Phocaeicola TaxID=909656 RepID=UPI00234F35E9|nr:hypothetical protein [Phocaeicola oris]MCE2615971.1 hypothetical protein [Phocaeicola oris]